MVRYPDVDIAKSRPRPSALAQVFRRPGIPLDVKEELRPIDLYNTSPDSFIAPFPASHRLRLTNPLNTGVVLHVTRFILETDGCPTARLMDARLVSLLPGLTNGSIINSRKQPASGASKALSSFDILGGGNGAVAGRVYFFFVENHEILNQPVDFYISSGFTLELNWQIPLSAAEGFFELIEWEEFGR